MIGHREIYGTAPVGEKQRRNTGTGGQKNSVKRNVITISIAEPLIMGTVHPAMGFGGESAASSRKETRAPGMVMRATLNVG